MGCKSSKTVMEDATWVSFPMYGIVSMQQTSNLMARRGEINAGSCTLAICRELKLEVGTIGTAIVLDKLDATMGTIAVLHCTPETDVRKMATTIRKIVYHDAEALVKLAQAMAQQSGNGEQCATLLRQYSHQPSHPSQSQTTPPSRTNTANTGGWTPSEARCSAQARTESSESSTVGQRSSVGFAQANGISRSNSTLAACRTSSSVDVMVDANGKVLNSNDSFDFCRPPMSPPPVSPPVPKSPQVCSPQAASSGHLLTPPPMLPTPPAISPRSFVDYSSNGNSPTPLLEEKRTQSTRTKKEKKEKVSSKLSSKYVPKPEGIISLSPQ